MLHRTCSSIATLCVLFSAHAQSTFTKAFLEDNIALSNGRIVGCSDGGLLLQRELDGQASLLKLDPDGVPLWNKTTENGFRSVPNGNGLLVGPAHGHMADNESDTTTSSSAFVKIDAAGDVLWSRTFTSKLPAIPLFSFSPEYMP